MKKLNQFLKKSFEKQIDGTGLAVFRIAYSIVLLCEIAQFYYFRHLIFDKVPYLEQAEISFAIPIAMWFISVLFLIFGLFTRFFTIINYLMSLILIGTINTYEYHVFYAYMGVNFVLMFLPISQCLSLDRLLKKIKYSNTTFQYNPSKKVSQLFYFIPVYIAVALIYFDSVFFKLTAQSWLTGLGIWMPSSEPMMVHLNWSILLNNKPIMLFLGYFTLLFEVFFIFIFFRKKFRFTLFILGVLLHVGIFFTFPIPWFALTYCSIYLLLIPVSFWTRFFTRNLDKHPKLKVFYDVECPLCVRTKITVLHFNTSNNITFKTVQYDAESNMYLKDIKKETLLADIHSVDQKGNVYKGVDTYIKILSSIWFFWPIAMFLKIPGINFLANKIYNFVATNRNTERCTEANCGYNPPSIIHDKDLKLLNSFTLKDLKFYFFRSILFLFTFFQFIIILNSPLVTNLYSNKNEEKVLVKKLISKLRNATVFITKPLFGITSHNVFYDEIHYKGYNHIIAVTYMDKNNKEIFLPLINENGQPSYYNYGINWRKISFSTNSPLIDEKQLNYGVRDFTAFWAKKNNIDLNDATFLIKVKKIDTPSGWEKDFLNKQIAKPWLDGGFVKWENKKMTSFIKHIESL